MITICDPKEAITTNCDRETAMVILCDHERQWAGLDHQWPSSAKVC